LIQNIQNFILWINSTFFFFVFVWRKSSSIKMNNKINMLNYHSSVYLIVFFFNRLFWHQHEQVIRWVHLSFYLFFVQICTPTHTLSSAFTWYVLVVVLNAKVNNLVQYDSRQKAKWNTFISWNKRRCIISIRFFFLFRKGVELNSQCNHYHSTFINRIMVRGRERKRRRRKEKGRSTNK
jgi:hypothetical protein